MEFQRDIQRQKALSAGYDWSNAPSARKYRSLNAIVLHEQSQPGRAQVLVYLRAIVYLSHS